MDFDLIVNAIRDNNICRFLALNHIYKLTKDDLNLCKQLAIRYNSDSIKTYLDNLENRNDRT